MFAPPAGLARLVASGVWPSAAGPSLAEQQLRPIVPVEQVRRFAPEEDGIFLYGAPFRTVADLMAGGEGDFWQRYGAVDQIDPTRAVVLADFGIGSDTGVVLDYAADGANPPVLRLVWNEPRLGNGWVQAARDFDEFADMLGLGGCGDTPAVGSSTCPL